MEAFDYGISNARYAYIIEFKIDNVWERISVPYGHYEEAERVMRAFAPYEWPWGIGIFRTISFKGTVMYDDEFGMRNSFIGTCD